MNIKGFFYKEKTRTQSELDKQQKRIEELKELESQFNDFKPDLRHPINSLKEKKDLKDRIGNLKKEIEDFDKGTKTLNNGRVIAVVVVFFVLIGVLGSLGKDKEPDNTSNETEVVSESTDNTAPSLVSEASLVEDEKESLAAEELAESSLEETLSGEEKETSKKETEDTQVDAPENNKTDNKTFLSSKPQEYDGSIYVTVNDNEPYFSDTDKKNTESFEMYSQFDSLGRCGVAYANICIDLMPTGERENIGMIKPSGWHTIKYAGLVEGNYLYNRCHLIGYQLAGEQANELNLITGTRYFNTEGMLPFENEVADYVERTNNHVLYRVTPYFEGNNLVATGVYMEAYSVEDQGKGVKFNVFVYNIQPGVEIDYATGDSKLKDGIEVAENTQSPTQAPTPIPEPSTEPTAESTLALQAPASVECDWILNTNTKVFHYPDCNSVKQMKEKNKQPFTGTKEEAISMGYSPCHNCFHY